MRITHTYTTRSIKSQLARRVAGMEGAWRHVSSGKQVERPSDDPAAVSRILSYRSLLGAVKERRFQVEAGVSLLATADVALDSASQAVMKAQDLALASGSGSNNESDLRHMSLQVDQLLENLKDVANAKYDNRLLFADGAVNFSATDVAGLRLSRGSVFGVSFKALEQLRDELAAGKGATGETLEAIEAGLDVLVSYRTQVGARENRLEALQSRLLVMEEDLISRKSSDEEVDMARAMVDLKEEEIAYQAALAATARLMHVSLVDYL